MPSHTGVEAEADSRRRGYNIQDVTADDEGGSHAFKKPRLGNVPHEPTYPGPSTSLPALLSHSATTTANGSEPQPSDLGTVTRYTTANTSRSSGPRFPASILLSPGPASPSRFSPPPNLGTQRRPESLPSPHVASPYTHFRGDDSSTATNTATSSPRSSINNLLHDENHSHPFHGQMRAHQRTTTTSASTSHYGSTSPHETGSSQPSPQYTHSSEAYWNNAKHRQSTGLDYATLSYQHACEYEPLSSRQEHSPHTESSGSYYNQVIAATDSAKTSDGSHASTPLTGSWTDYLRDNSTHASSDFQPPTRPQPQTTTPAPAVPLRSIINPVDKTPMLSAATIPHLRGNVIQIVPDHEPTPPTIEPRRILKPGFPRINPVTGKTERRPRSAFTEEQRNETSQTRAAGACLRCKSQRVRVSWHCAQPTQVYIASVLANKPR